MPHPTHPAQIGGWTNHVADCYVWAEIYYLDSSSDYREYLPSSSEKMAPLEGELIMLDDRAPADSIAPLVIDVCAACLVLVLIAALILWG